MDMAEIKARNSEAGYHFFDKDTLRFFGSRVSETVYGDGYFVTSEQDRSGFGQLGQAWNGERRYTIRRAMPNGSIAQASTFGVWRTLRCAKRVAAYFAEREALGLLASGDQTREAVSA